MIEPSRPVINSRHSLFESARRKLAQSAAEKREILYNGLKDLLLESCFVMLADAELQEESLKPMTHPPHNNLTMTQINNIEQASIGPQNQA